MREESDGIDEEQEVEVREGGGVAMGLRRLFLPLSSRLCPCPPLGPASDDGMFGRTGHIFARDLQIAKGVHHCQNGQVHQ